MEEDWVEHCANWATIDDGVVRDNCFNNSAVVHQELLNRGWDTIGTPLYVATEWEAIKPAIAQQALISLFGAGFSVVKQVCWLTASRYIAQTIIVTEGLMVLSMPPVQVLHASLSYPSACTALFNHLVQLHVKYKLCDRCWK